MLMKRTPLPRSHPARQADGGHHDGGCAGRGGTMHYNFVRIHQTLRCTPAMAAGVTGQLWELADMVKVLEDWEAAKDR